MRKECKFKLEKETKGAVRYKQYEEAGTAVGVGPDDALFGTVYVRKARLEGETPSVLTIIVDTSG